MRPTRGGGTLFWVEGRWLPAEGGRGSDPVNKQLARYLHSLEPAHAR